MMTITKRWTVDGLKQMGELTLAGLALFISSYMANAQVKVVSDVPRAGAADTRLGTIDPSADLRLTIWLTMQNREGFDKTVEQLYATGTPSFHQWLSVEELLSYAPSPSVLKIVKDELSRQGLTVIEDGRDSFSIAVHGPAETIQAVFHTGVEQFRRNGRTYYANTTEASLTGEAAKYVSRVSGLNNLGVKPQIATIRNPKTGEPQPAHPLVQANVAAQLSSLYTNHCFEAPSEFTLGTPGQLPIGIYFGNVYDNTTALCGYTPSQMQAAYGLPAAYQAGLKGEGQTIVIVDPYGSTTIESDATVFNTAFGLPQLNSSNFKVIFPAGQPLDPAIGLAEHWNAETSLDVEWAHVIAPDAKIVVVVPPADDDQDLQYAVEYAVTHKLGSVISNSYGTLEIEEGPAALNAYNQVAEMAAAVGISANYATGDSGDNGLGSPVGAVADPADSPYVTAVGGTSLAVPGGSGSSSETGWGNNQTLLASSASTPSDPPVNAGFVVGSGGGESIFFSKPSWQRSLSGKGRHVPDVSMDADPFTGAILIYTSNGVLVTQSTAGTSLSCPMFSAFWALANQKAGHWLGQAAPIISELSSTALNDIVPSSPPTNVAGTVIDSSGPTFYSAASLAAPLEGTTEFTSTVWPIEGLFIDLTFGTDTSLQTAIGWDDVTGYGSPKGLHFIEAAAAK